MNQDNTRPNIIVILVDDMGYSDLGFMGSEIKTPNLDRMALNGQVYTSMYNCGRCCPTRASLLTGLYSHKARKFSAARHWQTNSQLLPVSISTTIRVNSPRPMPMHWMPANPQRSRGRSRRCWWKYYNPTQKGDGGIKV